MPADDDLGHFLFARYTSGSDDPATQTKIGLQSSGVTGCAAGLSETMIPTVVAGEEWWWSSCSTDDDGSTQPLHVMVPAATACAALVFTPKWSCVAEIRGWSGDYWSIGVNALRHSDHVSIVAPTHRPHVTFSHFCSENKQNVGKVV